MTHNKHFHSLLKETVIISTVLILNAKVFLYFFAEPIKFPVGFKLFLKCTEQDTLLLKVFCICLFLLVKCKMCEGVATTGPQRNYKPHYDYQNFSSLANGVYFIAVAK